MSKTRIFAILMVALILSAILTNPSIDKHKEAMKEKAAALLKNQLAYKDKGALDLGMTLFGDRLIDEFVSSNLIVENYYLFSLTKVRWESKETIIGGGAFTKVWLSPKIDEEADKIIKALKSL